MPRDGRRLKTTHRLGFIKVSESTLNYSFKKGVHNFNRNIYDFRAFFKRTHQ